MAIVLWFEKGGNMTFLWFKTKKEKEIELKRELEKKEALERTRLGMEVASELRAAAYDNTLYNMLSDGTKSDVGPIEIETISQGGVYSIFVSVPDPKCFTFGGLRKRGTPILQADVAIVFGEKPQHRLHVHYGPYGPEGLYSDFAAFKNDVTKYVRNYRLYPSSR